MKGQVSRERGYADQVTAEMAERSAGHTGNRSNGYGLYRFIKLLLPCISRSRMAASFSFAAISQYGNLPRTNA